MSIYTLTPNERKLIIEASKIQIENLTELHDKGHTEFDEFLEEYDEEDKGTISCEIVEKSISFEYLIENPNLIFSMDKHSLIVMQFIILRMLPDLKWANSKRNIYHKIQNSITSLN